MNAMRSWLAGLAAPRHGRHLSRAGYGAAQWLLWLLIPAAVYVFFPGYLLLATQIAIACVFALSLDLVLGYAGIVTLGHAASFGLGAYTAGLLAVHGWTEPFSGLVAAALVAAVVGGLTACLLVRLGDLSRLMVTLGIGLMLFEAANKAASITGGLDGLSGMQMGRVLGLFEFDVAGQVGYWYSVGVLLLVFLFLRQLVASPFGLSLRAIHQCVGRAPSLGMSVGARLVAAYTLGAALAGVAGALLAQTTQFVGLDSLGFNRSADVLVMLMLGGAGRLYGALFGPAIFMLAHDLLASLNPVYWQFWIGIMLVALVVFARGGLTAWYARLRQTIRTRRSLHP